MHINRLANEKSPYLLQHAHNPVDWFPWGEEAFAKARAEDKPIFLSIGYSTCHWCHVMERESFESEAIAEVLNRYFVPVKLDREERPDIDRVYMMFVQATTGSGGWPMSVWLTPDLRPFFGGTYFPPDGRWGRPGFKQLLEQIAGAWLQNRAQIETSSKNIVDELSKQAAVQATANNWLDPSLVESCFQVFRRSYDPAHGGFGQAPKFPRPVAIDFLLRHGLDPAHGESREMAVHTLREMAKGGMHDHLGGGFHRYSVDERWFVPHFEKMLYDQAQLAVSYLEAFQVTGDAGLADVARDIFEYVLRDLRHPGGAFFSAEDADSVIHPDHPREKGEGAFYIWSATELAGVLGKPVSDWFAYRFGVLEQGNVAHDPHDEFRGRNILYEAHSLAETADRFGVPVEEVEASMEDSARAMLEARALRVRPHLDDKILTSWNSMMISAFALGAQILGEASYESAAVGAMEFLTETMWKDGLLLRRFRDGDAGIPAFLDDYAFLTTALIDLWETTFETWYLDTAMEVADAMMARFEDPASGGFFSSAEGDERLVMRLKDDYDGAEPSGNSAAVTALLRLAMYTGEERYRESAARTLVSFGPRLRTQPHGIPKMLSAWMLAQGTPRQIVISDGDGAGELIRTARAKLIPNRILLPLNVPGVLSWFIGRFPAVEQMAGSGRGSAEAYVCENFTCKMPVSTASALAELLQ